MRWLLIIIFMFDPFTGFVKPAYQQSSCQQKTKAQAPRLFNLDSLSPTGKTLKLGPKDDLQAAIDAANPGDEILLPAGVTFTGNFTLPVKEGSDYIYIRTADDPRLPLPGNRMFPAFNVSLAKIVSPNSDAALKTMAGAHHYWFTNLEFGLTDTVTLNYGIILLGDGSAAQSELKQVPHDIIMDRCYIHGNDTTNVSRGIALNSSTTTIIDSYISNCHGVGFDAQAICGWNGPGPFKIINNYLEASGENVLFGGADPYIAGLVPADIEFRRNHCFKPLTWKVGEPTYAGIHWAVKNLFELKNAQRVLIEGNLFEQNWPDGQNGFSVLFTPRNQDGKAPWSVVQDVTFTNNILRHVASAINILGNDDIYTSQPLQRVEISNNLFDDIGGEHWGGSGRFLQVLNGATDLTVDHNTIFHTGDVIMADAQPSNGFIYTNNISRHNEYGIIGSGVGVGNKAVSTYFPNGVFAKNILAGGQPFYYSDQPDNFFPPTLIEVDFTDLAGGDNTLAYNSVYKNVGTNGSDIGANVDEIEKAFSGSDSVTPTSATSANVVINFSTSIKPQTQLEYGTTTAYGKIIDLTPKSLEVSLTDLDISTVYYYRIRSKDANKNPILSNGFSFVTLTIKPPVISRATIQSNPKKAIITWTTNEPTDTQLEYGTTTLYGESLPSNTEKTLSHSVILRTLLPKTVYHYRIKSLSDSGNLSVTSDQMFETPREH